MSSVHAGTIIFDDDFNDTTSATQAFLVASVTTGTWVETFIDTSVTNSGHFHLGRGDYDYTAMFTHYGSVADGGTITMDLSFQDSPHDYNTVSILEGATELFRIEVQTDDGGANGTDAQINLVGATTENIAGGIRESSTPNRTFEFTLDATSVDLSITGDGLGSALTASVDYGNAPSRGPDRIRFFKNDVVGSTDRGQLPLDDLQVDFNTVVARNVLVDFDDGNSGNGIHDTAVNDGDFSLQTVSTTIADPWQCISSTPKFQNNQVSGIGSDLNAEMAGGGRTYAVDTGHRLAADNVFNLQFFWKDAFNWDAGDAIQMILYYTDDDTITGTATEVFSVNSGGWTKDNFWEVEHGISTAFSDASGYSKKLFLKFETNADASEYARLDNVFLELIGVSGGSANGSIFRIK